MLEQSTSQQQTKTEPNSSDYYKKELMGQTEADTEGRQENVEKLGNNHHKADYQTLKKMDYLPHHHHFPEQQQPQNAYYPSYGEQRQMNNLKDNHAFTNHNHYDEGNSEENENNEQYQENEDQQAEPNNDVKYNKDMDQNLVRSAIIMNNNNNNNQEQEMIMEDTWNNGAMNQQQEFRRLGNKEEETGDEDEVDTSETRDISVANTNSANSVNNNSEIKKLNTELATTTNKTVGEEDTAEIGQCNNNTRIIVEGPTVDTDIAQLLSRRKFSTDNNNNNNNNQHHCQQQQSSPGKRLSMGTIHNNNHNSNNRRNSNTSSTSKQNYTINNAGMHTNKAEDDPGKALEVETDEDDEEEKAEDYLLISASGKELEKLYPNQQQVRVTEKEEEVVEKDYSTENNTTEIDDEDDNVEDEEVNEINVQLNNNKNNYNSYGFRRRPTETDMLTGHSAAATVTNKTASSINPLTSSNVDDHHNNQYNLNRRRSSNIIKPQSQQQQKNKIIADNKNVLASEQSRSKKLTQPGLNTNRQVTFVNGNGNDDSKIKKKKFISNSSNLTNSSLLNTNAIKTNPLKPNVTLQQSSDEDDQFQYHHNRFILDANNLLNNSRSTIKLNTNTNSDLKANNNMAATSFVSPSHQQGLASLAQLDADTLANLDYIPTMKV